MATIKDGNLLIELPNVDGSLLRKYQEALILGIERIAGSEGSGDDDHRNSVYFLSEILRAIMLDDSQTNIGIGGRAYKKENIHKLSTGTHDQG